MKNKFGLKKLAPFGIGLLVLATFVGSISGSLAWWAYSTRVTVSFQGTSINECEHLQIGLKTYKFDNAKVAELEATGLEEDTDLADGDYRYVFAEPGGGFDAESIKKYLQLENKYSYNALEPVTSRTYTSGSDIHLYERPMTGTLLNTTIAKTDKYIYIPFVFRVLDGSGDKLDDIPIYLSGVQAEAHNETPSGKAQNALRVHFNNGTAAEQFILNVGDNETTEPENMFTYVAGCLDLIGDGVYDDNNTDTEAIYGDYSVVGATNTFVQASTPTVLSNINGVQGVDAAYLEDLDNNTTFLASHANGKTCYTDYTGINRGKAFYKTLDAIKPDSSSAQLVGGTPLCETSSTNSHLADLNLTIWLEGWDHHIVDGEIGSKFNLGLQFQIDLLS